MGILELLWKILVFGGIGFCFLMFIGGKWAEHYEKKHGSLFDEPTRPIPPQKVEKYCPYCGGDASKFYTPGEEKYPTMFTCSDCYRSFGDPSRMSGEESKIVAEQEEVCRRVENLPELQNVIDTVHALVKQKSDFVSVKDGRVFTMKHEYGTGTVKNLVCSYTSGLGKVGDQYLSLLCMQYAGHKLGHLGVDIRLTDHGLGWEWPK